MPCGDGHHPHSCLAASIPFWSQPLRRVRCCMRCCVRYWMSAFGLGQTEAHWLEQARHMSGHEASDDWEPSRLHTHADGEVLLGEMAMAVLSHGNVINPRKGSAWTRLTDSLGRLSMGPLLLLHSNEAQHVSLVLYRLNKDTTVPRAALSIVSRDDIQIPTAESLEVWRSLRARWQRAGAPSPQWFVQNIAGSVATAPASDGIRPFPIGVHDPKELSAFLAHAPDSLEAQVGHRSTLLMCCCMQMKLMERWRAREALQRNGFACDSNDVGPAEATLRAALKRSGDIPSEARRHAWRYYAALMHSRFVASPEGHGRDCYRTWEALALGAIPVLRRKPGWSVDERKFAYVPVVWVDEWEQLTPRFLEEQWALLRGRAQQRQLEARGAHFPFWLHEVTAGAVAGLHGRRGG